MKDRNVFGILVAALVIFGAGLFVAYVVVGEDIAASMNGSSQQHGSMHSSSDAQMMNGTNASDCNGDMHNSHHNGTSGDCTYQNGTHQDMMSTQDGMMTGRGMV